MVFIVYPLWIYPVRVRAELEKNRIRHLGVSYTVSPPQTFVALPGTIASSEVAVEKADRAVGHVVRRTKMPVVWEEIEQHRRIVEKPDLNASLTPLLS